MPHYNTIVIGAGPSGLAASYYLQTNDVNHLVLDQAAEVGSSWNQTWDNFRLAMPVSDIFMPGLNLTQYQRNHHLSKDEVITLLKNYAHEYQLPLHLNTSIRSITKDTQGVFHIVTNRGTFTANNVISCIGPRGQAKLPSLAKDIPAEKRIHSSEYKNPNSFPKTKAIILVVGSGLSALDIAHEIRHKTAHHVQLACAYNDEEVIRNNFHLFEIKSTYAIERLPSRLEEKGIINFGQLTALQQGFLEFKHHTLGIIKIPLAQFDRIIFATGYEPVNSFQMFSSRIPGTNDRKMHSAEGFYSVGVFPLNGARTITINQGSHEAKKAVNHLIRNRQIKSELKSPSVLLARL